jgi:hypothetical protein
MPTARRWNGVTLKYTKAARQRLIDVLDRHPSGRDRDRTP